ncbi:hypothetical protein C8Q77DRAFT_1156300 [Trametes polyzona]|nr:hypothetical protein C8Q77DRAFT_1156300 [Trametes polyzona]
MTSLKQYAARRNKAFYYSPGSDPTVPTGTPIPESELPALRPHSPELRECSAAAEDQICEPLGVVADIAREYARLRNENPAPAAPVLDAKALRLKKKAEKEAQERREEAIFVTQYHKMMAQDAYVTSVYRRMEEAGYFDKAADVGHDEGADGESEGNENSKSNQDTAEERGEEADPVRSSSRRSRRSRRRRAA